MRTPAGDASRPPLPRVSGGWLPPHSTCILCGQPLGSNVALVVETAAWAAHVDCLMREYLSRSSGDEPESDGQPDEAKEWEDFDPDT